VLTTNLVGKRFNDFYLLERIGRGGMAVVYRAHQESMKRDVALKLLLLDSSSEEREVFTQRFAQEVSVIASLEHIHILPVYAYGTVDNEFVYMAMRLLRGSVAELLQHGPLPVERAVHILTQTARGLAHAHRAGVIHRDIKPSNILLDDQGNAFLSDFGLAKVVQHSLELTRSGNIVGTPTYIAPELVRGQAASMQTDIYSLGVLLYHMLVGRPPFELTQSGVLALLYKHAEEPPPPLRALNSEVPEELEAIVMHALAKDPQDRYTSADEIAEDLEAMFGRRSTGSLPAIRTPGRISRSALRVRQQRMRRLITTLIPGLILLLLILIAVGYFILTQPGETSIRLGSTGSIDDVRPDLFEVARARNALGQGFIAYINCSNDNLFQLGRAREVAELASRDGIATRVYDSADDGYVQVSLIEQARAEGARAIILCPIDPDLLDASLAPLIESRFPLAFVTRFDYPWGTKLDSQNARFGTLMGEYAGTLLNEDGIPNEEQTVAILTALNFPSGRERAQGAELALRERAPEVTILPWLEGFTRSSARENTQALLDQGVLPSAFITSSDLGAYGVIEALTAAGVAPDETFIVSANGEPQAQLYIRDGVFMRGTVDPNRLAGSQLLYYSIIMQLAGTEIPENLSYSPGQMITRDNLNLTMTNTLAAPPADG
jgi:ABC-type sugar transport system substrate-binding protein